MQYISGLHTATQKCRLERDSQNTYHALQHGLLQNKNPNAMSEYQRKLAGIWKRNNCHPVKSILPILVQAPVFIGFFTSLQSLAQAKV